MVQRARNPWRSLLHNLKWRKVKTNYSALRHRPYNVSSKAEDSCISLLYYVNGMDTLQTVMNNDGRFYQDVQFTREDCPDSTEDFGSEHIMQIENYTVEVSSQESRNSKEPLYVNVGFEKRHAYTCSVCLVELATYYVQCGHVYCNVCIPRLTRCPICRIDRLRSKPITSGEIDLTDEKQMTCQSCNQIKRWMTDCDHLSCRCYKRRCCVCRKGPVRRWTRLMV